MNLSKIRKIEWLFILLAIESLACALFYEVYFGVVGLIYILFTYLSINNIKTGKVLSKIFCSLHFLFLCLCIIPLFLMHEEADPEAYMTVYVNADQIRLLFVAYLPFFLVVLCLYLLFKNNANVQSKET
jgi:hypothetical protein